MISCFGYMWRINPWEIHYSRKIKSKKGLESSNWKRHEIRPCCGRSVVFRSSPLKYGQGSHLNGLRFSQSPWPLSKLVTNKIIFYLFCFFLSLGCRREQKLSSLYQQICLKTPNRSTPSTTSIALSRVSAQSSTKSLLILHLGTE